MTSTATTAIAAPRPHPDVMTQHVQDELVLVHLLTNQIYTLNGPASSLWQLLETGHDLEHCLQALMNEYEVERDELEEDVKATVQTLTELNFLVSR
jgi:hypothetical protein